ncbi:hypothetical protein [Pokkaliibacter plantistimulans]|uniref:hypothetical protein n=1 Tax=Pokkaliibacter plantistimulans TaxID=1635171 RepID=UPI001FB03FF2|nr:hypothetical protein [Pokkaliibacter plantistimulans]
MAIADRIRINEERLLSDNWYILKTTSFDFQRSDGEWQTLPMIAATAPPCCCITASSAR